MDEQPPADGNRVPNQTLWRPDLRAPAPGLHFVSTPIGAARDITLRALDILAAADVLVAEDTRTLRHLMEIHGVALAGRQILAYHDHNGARMRPRILAELAAGRSVAYASEAGTPLVADPGYQLSRAAIEAGVAVHAAPGASAVLTALAVAGLPTDRFVFAGFLPAASGPRLRALADLSGIAATLILYESPRRLGRLLAELATAMGGEREAAVCRELTKRFEEVSRGTLASLARDHADRTVKGEVVVVVDRAASRVPDAADGEVEAQLRAALATMTVRDASTSIAEKTGLARRDLYQLALRLTKDEGGRDA